MQLHTYLNFDGRCEEAFNFYRQALGGEILFMLRNGESPMTKDMPTDQHNRFMHARIRIGEQVIMGSDMQDGCMEKP